MAPDQQPLSLVWTVAIKCCLASLLGLSPPPAPGPSFTQQPSSQEGLWNISWHSLHNPCWLLSISQSKSCSPPWGPQALCHLISSVFIWFSLLVPCAPSSSAPLASFFLIFDKYIIILEAVCLLPPSTWEFFPRYFHDNSVTSFKSLLMCLLVSQPFSVKQQLLSLPIFSCCFILLHSIYQYLMFDDNCSFNSCLSCWNVTSLRAVTLPIKLQWPTEYQAHSRYIHSLNKWMKEWQHSSNGKLL